ARSQAPLQRLPVDPSRPLADDSHSAIREGSASAASARRGVRPHVPSRPLYPVDRLFCHAAVAIFLAGGCPLDRHSHRRCCQTLIIRKPTMPDTYSKRCWFTFPTRSQVEQPIIWQMSQKFPNVIFDIRQASVQNEIGIMAVLLTGAESEVNAAIAFC